MVSSECLRKAECPLSWRVSTLSGTRTRSSNWRIGSNPASLERGEEESSTSTGREGKKSNDNRGTNCKLIVGPRVEVYHESLQHFIRLLGALRWALVS